MLGALFRSYVIHNKGLDFAILYLFFRFSVIIEIYNEIDDFIILISIMPFSTANFAFERYTARLITFWIISRLFEGSLALIFWKRGLICTLFRGLCILNILYFDLGLFVLVRFFHCFIQFFLHFK